MVARAVPSSTAVMAGDKIRASQRRMRTVATVLVEQHLMVPHLLASQVKVAIKVHIASESCQLCKYAPMDVASDGIAQRHPRPVVV